MIPISLCMIVKDEEQVLERCLQSAAELVEEIVIVDTGSSDRTLEIAAKYTDRIFAFDWIEDFGAARNYSFEQATKDYILWLDADDWLQETDREAFLALKSSLDPAIDAVSMNYIVAFDPHGGAAAVVKRHRLVKRSRQFRWVERVHEYLQVDGKIVTSDIAVSHGRTLASGTRNLRIYESMLAQGESFTDRQLLHYGMELTANGRYRHAIEAFGKCLDNHGGYFESKADCCDRIAHCYHQLGEQENELHALLRLFQYDVPRADYACRIAYFFQENEDVMKAIHWYRLALKLEKPENRQFGVNEAAWTWLPHLQLVACYGRIGDLQSAYWHNEKALSYAPDDANMLYNKRLLEERLAESSSQID
ncbi:glycosyltransferase [Paenibacillus sp. NPDC058071]|uniref:tetratricopeptide repeat-containing glycosyltransferase family 2 protein n=1 Tax=Paenibacillus sp. NPDC058071 TaxID=3346326 RepID=UPI0036D8D926